MPATQIEINQMDFNEIWKRADSFTTQSGSDYIFCHPNIKLRINALILRKANRKTNRPELAPLAYLRMPYIITISICQWVLGFK